MTSAGLIQLVLVGAGGFIGAVTRYLLSGFVQRILPTAAFPIGTLAVNVVGCLGIGLLAGLSDARSPLGPGTRLFLFIGVLGGFTTFSTFGFETFALLRDGAHLRAGANILLHLGLGLGSVWLGYALVAAR